MIVRGQNWEPGELTVFEKFESATSMSFAPMMESPCSHTVAYCLHVASRSAAHEPTLPYLAIIPVAVDVGDVDALALVNIQAIAAALLDREASDCHVAAPIERALVVLLMPEVNPHPPFRLDILRIVQIIHLHSLSSFTQTRGIP